MKGNTAVPTPITHTERVSSLLEFLTRVSTPDFIHLRDDSLLVGLNSAFIFNLTKSLEDSILHIWDDGLS